MINEKLLEIQQEEERQSRLQHRDVLLAIGVLLQQKEGLTLFKYLFKNLDVVAKPDLNLDEKLLWQQIGFLNAGHSIFELICEADPNIAGQLIAELERERYERRYKQYRAEQDNGTED
jgi:hypothetical protein